MNVPSHLLLALLLICGAASRSFAGDAKSGSILELYSLKVWDTDNGLPQVSARSVAQTPDGYVWVGTFVGIGRIDGETVQLNPDWHAEEHVPWWVSLHVDSRGRLWAGTGADIWMHSGSKWKSFGKAEGWPGGLCTSICESKGGQLYFGLKTSVYEFDGRSFSLLPALPFPSGQTHDAKVASDGLGRVWSLAGDKLLMLQEDRTWKSIPLPGALNGTELKSLARSKDGGIWVAGDEAIAKFSNGAWGSPRLIPAEFKDVTYSMLEDKFQNLWVGGFYSGLMLFRQDGGFMKATEETGLPSGMVTTIIEDREGHILVGTGVGGLLQFTHKRAFALNKPFGIARRNQMSAIALKADGSTLTGTESGEIIRTTPEGLSHILDLKFSPGSKRINTLWQDGPETCWVGVEDGGLWLEKNGKAEPFPGGVFAPQTINCLFKDSKGRMWVGGTTNTFVVEGGKPRAVAQPIEISTPTGFCEDAEGRIWCAASDFVWRFSEGEFKTTPFPKAPSGCSYAAVLADEKGRVWASLDGVGVLILDSQNNPRTLGRAEGLPRGPGALIESDEVMWIASSTGIYGVGLASVDRWLVNPESRLSISWISTKDGLPHNSCLAAGQPGMVKTKAGMIHVPTRHGAASFDPKGHETELQASDIQIESIVDGGKPRTDWNGFDKSTLELGSRVLKVEFTCPSLQFREQLRFRCRLKGFQQDWIDCGNRGTVDFVDIRPGAHDLEIQARLNGRLYAVKEFSFVVPSKIWERAWFIPAAFAIFASLLGGGVWRAQQNKLDQKVKEFSQQAALSEARARSELLLNATDEIVCFADESGELKGMNETGRKLLAPVASNAKLQVLCAGPSIRSLLELALPSAMQKGQWAGELDLAKNGGGSLTAFVTLRHHRKEPGVPGFLSFVAKDLTAARIAETEKLELQTQLMQAQKIEAIGKLAGGVAHDFNNLLAAILGNSELLAADPELGRNARESVVDIKSAALRARDLVRQILTFSRRQDHKLELFDPGPVISEGLRLLRSGLPTTIQLEGRVEKTSPIRGNPTQLHQVLMNLVTNASQAIRPTGGQIKVTLSSACIDQKQAAASLMPLKAGEHVVLEVTDNGEGMDQGTVKKAFEPFFTTKAHGQGTGLGLAVVQSIVRSHSGSISVSSTLLQGSTFKVMIPAASGELGQRARPDVPEARGNGSEILLVDDESAVLKIVELTTRKWGYNPTCCTDPAEAISKIKESPGRFKVVLTDLTMPGMTGVEMAEQIQRIEPGIPIILATGYGVGLNEASLAGFGIVLTLDKPYEMGSLAKALSEAIEIRAN